MVFTEVDNLFTQELIADLTKVWREWLDPLVPKLPNMDVVLKELRERFIKIGYNM